jgi:hypothetical protein
LPTTLPLPSLSLTLGSRFRISIAAGGFAAVAAVLGELIPERLNLLCHPRYLVTHRHKEGELAVAVKRIKLLAAQTRERSHAQTVTDTP